MIQLYCLQCNRPNDAEARYCSGCGTGLIRKFCARCHALNGAESHFCQACGASLPLTPGMPPPRPDAWIPSLTDTVEMPSAPAADPVAGPPRWVSPPAHPIAVSGPVTENLPAVDGSQPPPEPTQAPTSPPRRGVLSPAQWALGVLGTGAVIALAAAMSLRPGRIDPTSVAVDALKPVLATGGRPRAEAAGDVATTVVPARDTRSTTAGRAEPVLEKPRVVAPTVAPDGSAAAATDTPKASGTSTVARPAAGVVAATTAPVGAARARPTRAAASAPPTGRSPECTPEVDALGLCAPGAKIIGRP